MLNLLLPNSQPNERIYDSFENLVNSINLNNWFYLYVFFELKLIKELGYDTNLNKYISKNLENKELIKTNIDGNHYEVPNYLIKKQIPENFTNYLMKKSLYFTRQVMQNKFFIPNNILFPKSRIILENYFNEV